MKKIQPLHVFGVLVFGAVWLVLLMYSIGWAANWKLPGLATLKRHFSSNAKQTATVAAAANISAPTYCPNNWAITYSDGYTKYTCTSTSNSGACGSSATFSTQWSSDGKHPPGTYSKKQWAQNCHVKWDNPADGIPSSVSSSPIYGDARAENSIGYGY